MRLLLVSLLAIRGGLGPQPEDPAAKIRTAMQASLDLQRSSVRKQAETAKEVEPGTFFTIPWPSGAVPSSSETAEPESVRLPVSRAADPACDPLSEPELAALIDAAAKREELEPGIVRAVVRKESASRPCAVSPKGAQGLMQLMPVTSAYLSVSNPFDPKQNIDAGTKLLKLLLTKYAGDLSLALGAYNAGSGRVDKVRGVPQIAETQNYVADILKDLGK